MYHNKQIHIFTVWEWLTSQIKRSVLYWPAGCSVHPASRRRASSQRSPIRPSDLWCQRSGTWQAQGGLWLGSTWTSGLRPTATESHSRIQLTGEAQSPSLAEERKEKGQQDGEEGTESEAWVKMLDESCVVKKKKNTETTAQCWKLRGAEVIILEAPADTQRNAPFVSLLLSLSSTPLHHSSLCSSSILLSHRHQACTDRILHKVVK